MSGVRPRDHRLPRGRHDLSAEEVAANQYWRLIAATARLVAVGGVGQVTGRAIASEAGVSSSTLYQLFGGVDGAVLATFEVAADALIKAITVGPGSEGMGSGTRLVAACEWATREPQLAAMLGAEPAVALPEVAVARERLVARLTRPLVPHLSCREGDTDTLRRLLVATVLTMLAEQAASLGSSATRRLGQELAALLD